MGGKYASLLPHLALPGRARPPLPGGAAAQRERTCRGGEWQPPIDIVETPDAILILVEVPGLAAADLKVEVRGHAA